MRYFELPDERAELLREILVHHLSELRMEISNTDHREFREYLRERIDFLEDFTKVLGRESGSGQERLTEPALTPGRKPENLDFLLE